MRDKNRTLRMEWWMFMVYPILHQAYLKEVSLTQKSKDHDIWISHIPWFLLKLHMWRADMNRTMIKYFDVGSLVTYIFPPCLKAHDLTTCNFKFLWHGLWMNFKGPYSLIVTALPCSKQIFNWPCCKATLRAPHVLTKWCLFIYMVV